MKQICFPPLPWFPFTLRATCLTFGLLGLSALFTPAVLAQSSGDRAVLEELYDATDGDNWAINTNWKNDAKPLDEWYAVRTDANGRVTSLGLTFNHLSGSIPPSLGNLANLTDLLLNNNRLSGAIPTELGSLTNLTRLYLNNNDLSGAIPAELGSLTNLTRLYLNNNRLSGAIPTELGSLTNLTRLYLNNNDLSGPIPPSLGNLSKLTILYLDGNRLSGAIPAELGSLTNLTDLRLSNNRLSGPIPTELGSLTNLAYLLLHSSHLSGPIPPSLGNLTKLVALFLDNNRLSGPIPTELGSLTNLAYLLLDNNQLSGAIPPSLGNLTGLAYLLLDNNRLSGPIPTELGSLTNLTQLLLYNNDLSGPIPPSLSSLTNLTHLNLYNNRLSGPIPPSLGNLINLTHLALNDNRLSGPIPTELGSLTNLTYLALSSNHLNGPIPFTLGNLTNLTSLFLHDNRLSEYIPIALGKLTTLNELTLDNNAAGLCRPDDMDFAAWLEETLVADFPQCTSTFENPRPASFQSGIGVISGWACDAEQVIIEFDRPGGSVWRTPATYGTSRIDTEAVCGDSDNGFSLLWNWNTLGPGIHTVRAIVDDVTLAEHTLTVTTLGLGEFPTGLSGEYELTDFPASGETTMLQWQEVVQNFGIVSDDGGGEGHSGDSSQAVLENPQPTSFQSGIGVIFGWVCEAETIEIQFEHGITGAVMTLEAGYGTSRTDTEAVCGDSDNGFSLLWNWNHLGDGQHTVRALADGEEFAWSTFTVTTLGEEFVRGLSGEFALEDFPQAGTTVTVEWQEALQNFTLIGVEQKEEQP